VSPAGGDVQVRPVEPGDFSGIIELTRAVYPFTGPYTEKQLASQHGHFPEGQLVAVQPRSGRIVGMASSLIVTWDDYDLTDDWHDFTDGGLFTNHDPDGRTLYGAEIMVDPMSQGKGVGKLLYAARRDLVRRLALRRIRAGARLRGYHRYADHLSAREYAARVARGDIGDPTVSFQIRQGFRVIGVVGGYLVHDPESLGWAAVIEWLNPDLATPEELSAEDQHDLGRALPGEDEPSGGGGA
jgi:GNAT superfamily N-acetyltransferase